MDPRMIPKGQSPETQFNGQDRKVGIYYHPFAKKFIETAGIQREDGTMSYDEAAGRIQADSFTQIGYRPATDEEAAEYFKQKKEAQKESKPASSK